MFYAVTVQGDIIGESEYSSEIIESLALDKIEEIERNLSIEEKIEHNHYIYMGKLNEQLRRCDPLEKDKQVLAEFKEVYNDNRFIDREQMIFIMET